MDKFWKGHDGQTKKNACKNAYLGSFFIPEKYVIRVLFVCPWMNLIPPLAIQVPPPRYLTQYFLFVFQVFHFSLTIELDGLTEENMATLDGISTNDFQRVCPVTVENIDEWGKKPMTSFQCTESGKFGEFTELLKPQWLLNSDMGTCFCSLESSGSRTHIYTNICQKRGPIFIPEPQIFGKIHHKYLIIFHNFLRF